MDFPRIVIAALRGGSGKTMISIGLIAALIECGKSVAPYKKGPDYIDAGWLSLAAGRHCYNLDTFLSKKEHVLRSFLSRISQNDIAVIEGNRGLYDGVDSTGSTSTAELAKFLKAPIVLCIDCTKSTCTMAAVVLGCMRFDSDVMIEGIVLNRVAGARHENVLRKSIERHCGIPVLGAIPKLSRQNFPERHMGLVPTPEHVWAKDSIATASKMASLYLDIDSLIKVAYNAPANFFETQNHEPEINITNSAKQTSPKIGIIKDSAFQFYYPENIEALIAQGAEILFISPFTNSSIPPVDALYIGGGFPETHAQKLSENLRFRNELKSLAENGLPIYAECGGLMYLGKELILDGKSYPMSEVLPISFGLSKKPQGHGYTIVTVENENPYFEKGKKLKGHEFHYSRVLNWRGNDKDLAFVMNKGTGFINKRDGVCYKNVFATYTHLHALSAPSWAKALVRNALIYQNTKQQ